jgi:23S rRNA U2552 (ribose-2'-O)-methylase RlmE/FtsJ
MVPEVRVGTRLFLIAPGAQELASCESAAGETKAREANKSGHFAETFSQKEERHEYDARTKNGLVHLHRQMDTQDFVFAKRQALSPWAVAPPAWERVAAHADQNSPESRIRGFNCQECDPIEDHHSRIFVDQTGKDNHRSTRRHVPLGKAIPKACER